jgi:hypothetical protein
MRLWRQHFWGGSREKVADALGMSVRKVQAVELGGLDLTLAEALLLEQETTKLRRQAAELGFVLPITPKDWFQYLRGLEKCA